MFIVCPKCFTKYLVSDEIQVKNLQKCHCSACGHYFEQILDNGAVQEVVSPKNVPHLTTQAVMIDEAKQVQEQKEALDALNESLPTAIFTEPLILDEKEKKSETDLLSVVPEEFKPVENKKTSFISMLLWLAIGAGICFFAYHQKDYFIDSIDSLVLSQLDKSKIQKQVEKETKTTQVMMPIVGQKNDFLPMKQEQVSLTPAEKLPVDIVVPAEQEIEVLPDNIENCIKSLQVQNIGYELGVNEVGMNRLLIKGMVVNTSLKLCPIPETKAVIYDDEDNIVARKRILFNEKNIAGNSELLFETAVVPSPKSVSKIEVVFDE